MRPRVLHAFMIRVSYSHNCRWLVALLQRDGENIYRFKGILNISGYDEQFIMHGVHMIFNGERGAKWKTDQKRISKIVFIGVNLNVEELDQHFTNCRASLLSSSKLTN